LLFKSGSARFSLKSIQFDIARRIQAKGNRSTV